MGLASLSEGFAKPLGGFRNDKPRSSLDNPLRVLSADDDQTLTY